MWMLRHLPPFLCMSPKQPVVWRKICWRKIPGSRTYCLPWASKPSVECHTAGHTRTKYKQYLLMLKHYIRCLSRSPVRRRNPQYPWKQLLTHRLIFPEPWFPHRLEAINVDPKAPEPWRILLRYSFADRGPSIRRHSTVSEWFSTHKRKISTCVCPQHRVQITPRWSNSKSRDCHSAVSQWKDTWRTRSGFKSCCFISCLTCFLRSTSFRISLGKMPMSKLGSGSSGICSCSSSW